MKIGITGGIGTGKSFVCKRLQALYGVEVYDCDDAAKRLIATSPVIFKKLTALVGDEAYLPDAGDGRRRLNKKVVTRFLLADEDNGNAINAIVHPEVFRDFTESGKTWMESAIMFESGINKLVDIVIAVTAPEETRIDRVMQRDGISRESVLQWMQRQWPQQKVIEKSHYTICNDGVTDIDSQLRTIVSQINANIQEQL